MFVRACARASKRSRNSYRQKILPTGSQSEPQPVFWLFDCKSMARDSLGSTELAEVRESVGMILRGIDLRNGYRREILPSVFARTCNSYKGQEGYDGTSQTFRRKALSLHPLFIAR